MEVKITENIDEHQELVKVNITEKALAEMEANFSKLEIRDIKDKEGYEAVDKARKMCKQTRLLTVKVLKANREDYIRKQKECVATENYIVGRIKKVEDDLDAKQKVIDDAKDEINRKRDLLEQSRLQERSVVLLQKYGMTYNIQKSQYELSDITVSVIEVKSCDDFTWATVIANVESRWKILEEERLEQLRLKEISDAEAKRIAEENIAKQEALNKRENELREKELKLQAEQEIMRKEAEAKLKADEEAKIAEEKRIIEERIKTRKADLFELGFSQQGGRMVFQELSIPDEHIAQPSDHWAHFRDGMKIKVNAIKERLENERIARDKKLVEDALEAKRKEDETKAKAEEIAREATRKENERIAAMAPDIDKFKAFCKTLAGIPLPEFTSDNYKIYVKSIADKRTAFLTDIFKNQPK